MPVLCGLGSGFAAACVISLLRLFVVLDCVVCFYFDCLLLVMVLFGADCFFKGWCWRC